MCIILELFESCYVGRVRGLSDLYVLNFISYYRLEKMTNGEHGKRKFLKGVLHLTPQGQSRIWDAWFEFVGSL